jgi:hypothetical protein
MEHLSIVAQLLAAISIVALLWLCIRAFSKNFRWGLGVLLLSPFSATAFGLKYWNEEKKPFLVYITSTIGFVFLSLYLFSSWGGWDVVRTRALAEQGLQNRDLSIYNAEAFMKANRTFKENSGFEINNPAIVARVQQQLDLEAARQAELEEIRKAQEEAKRESLDAGNINKKVSTKEKERYRLVYRTVKVPDAHKYVGATVKVTRRNALEKEYRLVGTNKYSLRLTQRNKGGSYSFSLRKRDIEKLRVLTKQPY